MNAAQSTHARVPVKHAQQQKYKKEKRKKMEKKKISANPVGWLENTESVMRPSAFRFAKTRIHSIFFPIATPAKRETHKHLSGTCSYSNNIRSWRVFFANLFFTDVLRINKTRKDIAMMWWKIWHSSCPLCCRERPSNGCLSFIVVILRPASVKRARKGGSPRKPDNVPSLHGMHGKMKNEEMNMRPEPTCHKIAEEFQENQPTTPTNSCRNEAQNARHNFNALQKEWFNSDYFFSLIWFHGLRNLAKSMKSIFFTLHFLHCLINWF